MSIVYDGSHRAIFIKANETTDGLVLLSYRRSWDDFHLIPDSYLSVANRVPSYMLVDVPFSSKTYDFTYSIQKGLFFDASNGEWTFYIDHDKWSSWYLAKSTIENYINGSKLYCILHDEPSNLYGGRFMISNWEDGSDYSKITIQYILDVYREEVPYDWRGLPI